MGYLSTRRPGLDTLRGMTLVSMMVYHACWDLVYLFRPDWATVFIWDITGCGADFYPWAEGRW